MIEKYTFSIVFPKKTKKIIFIKTENESRGHIALKLLSYIIYYSATLQVEVDIGWHYKPDLVRLSQGGEPELWIDCGGVGLKKVEKLTQKLRSGKLVLVKTNERELCNFRKHIEKKIKKASLIEYLTFTDGLVDNLARHLQKNNTLTFYHIKDNWISFSLGDEYFESELIR